MSLFQGLFHKEAAFLGVEIGTASIKIAELGLKDKNYVLRTFGYVDVASDVIHDKDEQSQQKLGEVLKQLGVKAGITTNQAVAALPTFAVFTTVVNVPKSNSNDIGTYVQREAQKYLPQPLAEMILEWQIVGSGNESKTAVAAGTDESKISSSAKEYLRVLVTAAPRELVKRYQNIFQIAGLQLKAIETEASALGRALLRRDRELTMIIDIGSMTTDMAVIENGLPVLNRSIDIGGWNITKSIAVAMGIDTAEAEQFKTDLAMQKSGRQLPTVVEESLTQILNTVKYVFEMYRGQAGRQIEKIVLVGGSASLPGLSDYLMNMFNVPVYVGNPWHDIKYDPALQPLLENIGTRMAVAVGLAMREQATKST
ncbi:MAG: type IV pilus assembly protein PilM [Candidatus Komeilibacteria bacterium]|nr:type IV pilus assembly protein PilM [Candidatus Komeilibacteria bacterium]